MPGAAPAPGSTRIGACRLRCSTASTMPLLSMPISLAGLRFATMTISRPTSALGLVGLGDAGDDGALLGARIDAQLHQLLRLRHALGGQHLRDAQLDAHELVDADARVGRARRSPRRRPAATAPEVRRPRRWLPAASPAVRLGRTRSPLLPRAPRRHRHPAAARWPGPFTKRSRQGRLPRRVAVEP